MTRFPGSRPHRHGRERSRPGDLALTLGAVLLLAAGCSGQGGRAPAADRAAAPDTLLAALAPRLADWIALWQQAAPAMRAESLAAASSGPFTLVDIHRYNARGAEQSRRLAWFAVWAPDSARAVEPDTCYDFDPAGNSFHRGPPRFSCATLVDLKISSIATLDTCGPSGDFDGALWLDAERFALTGTTTAGDTTGAGRGLVRLYDLGAGTVTEYRLPSVIAPVFERFRTVREIARVARLRRLTTAS